MDDLLSSFIAIIAFVVVAFGITTMTLFNKVDDSMQTSATESVTRFVDQVRAQGYITNDDYMNFLESLTATGNVYSITMYSLESEYYHTDEEGTDGFALGYTPITQSEIVSAFKKNEGTGRFYLSAGDYLYVEVKQTNTTLGQRLSSLFMGGQMPGINIKQGGRVGNTNEQLILVGGV